MGNYKSGGTIVSDTHAEEIYAALRRRMNPKTHNLFPRWQAIAKELGFDVTVDDFKEYYYSQAEMTPEEMEEIAAGKKKVGCPEYHQGCDKVCGDVCGTFIGHYVGKQR